MMDASMKHNGILYGLSHAVCRLSAHDLTVGDNQIKGGG